MTKLRAVTDQDLEERGTPFLNLKHIGIVELKLTPCQFGMKATFTVLSKTGLPDPLPQVLPRTVGEDHIHYRWWDRLIGHTLERKAQRLLKKWKKRLIEQDALLGKVGADLEGPSLEIEGRLL